MITNPIDGIRASTSKVTDARAEYSVYRQSPPLSNVWTGRGFYQQLSGWPRWLRWLLLLDRDPYPSPYDRWTVDKEPTLQKGALLSGQHDRYHVVRVLGEGGFGAVFEVTADADGRRLAAKVERRVSGRRSKLKMEWTVLRTVTADDSAVGTSHFTTPVDYNSFRWFRFFAMRRVGRSLADLKSARLLHVFSLATGFGVGLQSLVAIRTLHRHGFVHRDLKPANCAIGAERNERHLIYLLDFGIARRITLNKPDHSASAELKPPRRHVPFRGTVRYASRASHGGDEVGFGGDCESWLYMLLDLTITLPWRSSSKHDDVLRLKERYMTTDAALLTRRLPTACAAQIRRLIAYVGSLTYADHVDYDFVTAVLKEAGRVAEVDIDAPFDWET